MGFPVDLLLTLFWLRYLMGAKVPEGGGQRFLRWGQRFLVTNAGELDFPGSTPPILKGFEGL